MQSTNKEEKKFNHNSNTSPNTVIDKPILNNLNISENNEKNFIKDNNDFLKIPDGSIGIKSFRQLVDLFYQKREAMLHTYLYNNTKLISFKEGEVTINSKAITDPHITRTIAKLVSKWTGRNWQINSTSSNIGQTLYEQDLIEQQKNIDEMKNDNEIKSILDMFPDAKIHSITDIGETAKDDKSFDNLKQKEEE